MRLFIAIPFDDEMKQELVRVQDQLYDCGLSGNYTKEENLHLTLAFIGEYGDPQKVEEILEGIRFDSFDIRLQGIGSFRDLYWAGFAKQPELMRLAQQVRRALGGHAIPFDRKNFRPHVTLVRKAYFMNEEVTFPEDMSSAEMRVHEFVLMKSEFGKKGMIYTPIGVFPSDDLQPDDQI